MTEATMQHRARTSITAVGNRETFEANVAAFSETQQRAETQLAQMVAYAYAAYHRDGDTWPTDHIRATVKLAKGRATMLDKCLSRIRREAPEDGVSPSKAAIAFANQFVADFYGEVTKAREAAREKARAAREEKAKAAKKEAEDALKAAREEGKREAQNADDEITIPEFALCGEDGHIIPLTPEEYTYLAMMLAEKQQSEKDAATAARKADRDHAADLRSVA